MNVAGKLGVRFKLAGQVRSPGTVVGFRQPRLVRRVVLEHFDSTVGTKGG